MPKLTIELNETFAAAKGAFVKLNNQPIAMDQFVHLRFEAEVGEAQSLISAGIGRQVAHKTVALQEGGGKVLIELGRNKGLYTVFGGVLLGIFVLFLVLRWFFKIEMNVTVFIALLPVYIVLIAESAKPVIKPG